MATVVSIALDQLSKQYAGTQKPALNEVSLQVRQGEVYGFLGANGAGKTTTIRILLGFIYPTGGTASIAGKDIVSSSVEARKNIGYLAGDMALYPKLTGQEILDYMAELSTSIDKNYRKKLIDLFEAELDKPIGTLSRGNRQKISIIQAFMHQPEVLILDEPTTGLDPLMQEAFFKLISDSRKRGAAIFMSSHNFSEVQRICDRAGIIRNGKLVKEQPIAEFNNSKQQHFTVEFTGEPPLVNLSALGNVAVIEHHNKKVKIVVDGNLSPLLSLLAKNKVARLTSQTADLEEEFLQYYGEDEK